MGVYYAATRAEATMCAGSDVAVVGGGNSAGQAAVFLARQTRKVFILIRRGDLADTMSRYLIDQIERDERIELLPHTEVRALVAHLRAAAQATGNSATPWPAPLTESP